MKILVFFSFCFVGCFANSNAQVTKVLLNNYTNCQIEIRAVVSTTVPGNCNAPNCALNTFVIPANTQTYVDNGNGSFTCCGGGPCFTAVDFMVVKVFADVLNCPTNTFTCGENHMLDGHCITGSGITCMDIDPSGMGCHPCSGITVYATTTYPSANLMQMDIN